MSLVKLAKEIDYLSENIRKLKQNNLVYANYNLSIDKQDVKDVVLKALNELLEVKKIQIKNSLEEIK